MASNANQIEGKKLAKVKELVDNSELNDTIIAHIDSTVMGFASSL
jgi:hypothetical protein